MHADIRMERVVTTEVGVSRLGRARCARVVKKTLAYTFPLCNNKYLHALHSRRMFPVPDFFLGGLEPDQYYGCAVEIVAADMNRYRYKTPQGWVPTGKGMHLDQVHCKYLHPNSASLGQYWMAQGALFDKLKLSNHIIPSSDSVSVLYY